MKTDIAYIYCLIDPVDNSVRYIGKTIHPKNRLSGHIAESKKFNHYRAKWIKSLQLQNLTPIFKILKVCPLSQFTKFESELIKFYKSEKLTNSDESGLGNTGRKREIIDQISMKNSKVVYQYNIDGLYITEYPSTRDAARILGINHANISRVCNGKAKHANQLIFSFSKKEIHPILNPNAIKKLIIEVDSNGIIISSWKSLMDCSRETGIDNGNLSRVCNGKLKHIKNRYFKFNV